jgi:hypothetical protein
MKDQQLSNEPAQSTDTAPDAAPAEAHRLPPAIYHQVVRVQPGDGEALADLLDKYPGLQQQILAVASSHAGAATVRQAIELHRQEDEPEAAPPTVPTTDYAPGGEVGLLGGEPNPAPAESTPVEPTHAELAHAEPAWVAHARKYNAANATLTDEFNDLTDFLCSEESDRNQLNPVDVSHWQRARGLAADGMVGPHTVAAARANSAKNKANAIANIEARQAEARPPV